jgi:fatty-acyl-CoA synthase
MAHATFEQWGCRPDDVVLCNLPISHVGGTHDQLAVQLYAGAAGILVPKFDPRELMETISKQKVTFFGAVPSMYRLIFKTCDLSEYDLSSVRMTILGGEPASAELIRRIAGAFFNSTIAVSWGMSETAGFFTFSSVDDAHEMIENTEGKPAPGFEMQVAGFDGRFKKAGDIGEFLVRGPSVISGYLDAADNEGTFVDGWLKTGDLGFLDENGYMHYVGRSKEMYISGGYNVYPLEIETYLNTYPGVNAAAIIEFPDELWGEVGYAFVVPEEGVELSADELFVHCKKGLADYKRPKKIFVTREIPRSVVGKIAKKELRNNIDQFVR